MSNWKQDFFLALLLGAVSIAFFSGMRPFPHDARIFPELLSIFLGLLALYMAVTALRRRTVSAPLVQWAPYAKVLVQIACIALFAMTVRPLGYLPAGFLLCLATTLNAGYPRKGVAVAFSAAMAAVVFTVFYIILEVPLPMGIFKH